MKRLLLILLFTPAFLFQLNSQDYNFSFLKGVQNHEYHRDYEVVDIAGVKDDLYIGGNAKNLSNDFSIDTQFVSFPNDTNQKGFLAKTKMSGGLDWVKSIPSNVTARSVINHVEVDDSGYVYVSGFANQYDSLVFGNTTIYNDSLSLGYNTLFVAKLDSTGNYVWLKTGAEAMNGYGKMKIIDGNVYLSFTYADPGYRRHPLHSRPGGGFNQYHFDSILLDSMPVNNIPHFIEHIAFLKYELNGSLQYSSFIKKADTLFSHGSQRLFNYDFDIDSSGNAYLLNHSNYNRTLDNNIISKGINAVKLNPNGQYTTHNVLDTLNLNQGGILQPRIQTAFIQDNLYIQRVTNQTVTYLNNLTGEATHVLKLNPSLNIENIFQYSTLQNSNFNWISVTGLNIFEDHEGNVILSGNYRGPVTIFNRSLFSHQGRSFIISTDTGFSNINFFKKTHTNGLTFLSTSIGPSKLKKDDNSYLLGGSATFSSHFDYQRFQQQPTWPIRAGGYATRLVKCNEFDYPLVKDTGFICNQSTETLEVTGHPDIRFQWYYDSIPLEGENNRALQVNNSGEYLVVADSLGCRDTSNIIPVIRSAADSVSVSPKHIIICDTTSPLLLSGQHPQGGIWIGPGVYNDSLFNPSGLGNGIYNVEYQYADSSCSGKADRIIEIQQTPSPYFFPVQNMCTGDTAIDLYAHVMPKGGSFSGSGVINHHYFDPSIAGVGTHVITYDLSNNYGCSGQTQTSITVDSTPDVTLPAYGSFCRPEPPVNLAGASPQGGTWSGQFVSSSTFYPAQAGPGNHQVTYSYDDGTCIGSKTDTLTVEDSVSINIGAPYFTCSNDTIQLNAAPGGGLYSGSGVFQDTLFVPQQNQGTVTLTYQKQNTCNTDSAQFQVQIEPAPQIQSSAVPPVCKNDTAFLISGFTPAGGSFSGDAVNANHFDPSIADTGANTVTYTVVDSNGCMARETFSVNVAPAPQVNFHDTDSLCLNAAPHNLSALPAGGVFSGAGVQSGSFDPQTAGTGTHTLTYQYTDGVGCSSSDTHNLHVFHTQNPVWSLQVNSLCLNSQPVTLQQGTPSGGTFSGNGVSGNQFDPQSAGIGNYAVTYSVNTACGIKQTTDTLTVISANVTVSNISGICGYKDSISLNTGAPSGGTYFGSHVQNNRFSPFDAGTGTHTAYYSYQNPNGCSDTASFTIEVVPGPQAQFNDIDSICYNSSPLQLTGGTPAGGTYFGNHVTHPDFDPQAADTGQHTIYYAVTDTNGCEDTASHTLIVYRPEAPQWNTQNSQLCLNSGTIQLAPGNPGGGVFSGNGVTAGIFDPSAAGLGVHTITYTISTSCGSSQTTDSIRVTQPPQAQLPNPDPICLNEPSVALSGGTPQGGTYFGNYIGQNRFYPDSAGTGTHVIYYRYEDSGGCADTASAEITVLPAPQPVFSLPQTICENNLPLTLEEGVPTGGMFSGNGVSGNEFNPQDTPGIYEVAYSITDTNGCSGSDRKEIEVLESPSLNSGKYTFCFGKEAGIDAGNADFIEWNTGNSGTELTFEARADTAFSAFGTNNNGCADTADFTVTVNPTPNFSLGNDTAICTDETHELSAGENYERYLWNTGSENSSILISQTTDDQDTEAFSLTAYNEYNCSFTDRITIEYIDCDTLPVPESGSFTAKLYPNPSLGDFFIEFILEEDIEVEFKLLSYTGSLIEEKKSKLTAPFDRYEYRAARGIAAGNYFLIIRHPLTETETIEPIIIIQ